MSRTTIGTFGGGAFDLCAPRHDQVNILTIAHGLSNLCRFTGQTCEFYSVAQHSVMVSHLVPREHALAGLLHDAAEAYVGDVSSPLKALLPDYRAIEREVERAVLRHFGLEPTLPPCVKLADMVALRTEQRDLMGVYTTADGIGPLADRISPLPPREARRVFLARFAVLTLQEVVA